MQHLILSIVYTFRTATTSKIENSLIPLGLSIHPIVGIIGCCRSKGIIKNCKILSGVGHEHLFY